MDNIMRVSFCASLCRAEKCLQDEYSDIEWDSFRKPKLVNGKTVASLFSGK